jgi:hypothetical protein
MKISKTIMLLLCSVVLTANAQTKEVSGFQNPESVIAYHDKLFVSNMGAVLDPTAKDGDGFISMLSRKDGKMIQEKCYTGLNSPKGMQVRCGKLIVADVDRVVVLNIKSGKKIREVDLSKQGITYANDLVKVCGGVLVTSTLNNEIYKICMSGKVKKLDVKVDLPGANGLVKGCSKLYVANYGRNNSADGSYGKINRCTKKFVAFHTGGAFDGIAKIGHRLVLTDWVSTTESAGKIVVYNLCKKTSSDVNIGRLINGPADIYADCKTKIVWVPAMRENKILAVPYELIKK